ncbi:MAG: sigma-70 family RNA polymerase sigma factor [Opitutus sp.]
MDTESSPESRAGSRKDGAFPTTHWSMVLKAGGKPDVESSAALETLCGLYWYPLYAFVRRQGRSHHDAQDCTQKFFERFLAVEGIARARPERGRFRSYLLASLRNFMTEEWERASAAKRGGGEIHLSLDFTMAGEKFAREPVDKNVTPEQAFDCNWAMGVVERALLELRAEHAAGARGEVFDALAPLLWSDGRGEPLVNLGQRLGMAEGTVRVALHRMRKRLGECLRAQIAATVETDDEVADELHYLIKAIGAKGPAR